ncbi:MAG: signal peptide peptidase SppA [Stappia sp.]|uniref:signal peptide peptidase SppA n=1 Tax=Stappia sp. TaxID=1870903 RepID=UPI000C69D710|nr:signal peptide peptidase SppA [Stappia sp.]MAA99264.1 signal peptide peptidase SppA [Stappia sp.]MBM19326.1 signal peptide peptidase SppA [Stappia sp.]
MALDADAIIDRRRLRRKVVFWRIVAVLVAVVAVIAGVYFSGAFGGLSKRSAHIARLEISGVIIDDRDRLKLIDEIARNENVRAVILDINSPGGSTVGGESLYLALRKLAEKKPVVATIGTLGASAGYMTAIAADRIYARSTSLAGSIGVYIQYGNIKGLLDTIGVEFDMVRSGPLKGEPNFYDRAPEAARQNLQAVIDDSYAWFVDRVAERRAMDRDVVLGLAQGGIYSGERAKTSGLIDAIGGESEARDWLVKEQSLAEDTPIVTWRVKREGDGLPFAAGLARSFGSGLSDGLSQALHQAKGLVGPGGELDGLVSVWHAQGAADNDDGTGARE